MDRKTTAKDDQPYDQHCLMDKNTPKKYVKICFFNARSLRNKIAEVSEFVNINNVDILAVVETWFNHLDRDVTLPGFQPPFRRDRRTKGGGVCVFVSNQIPCIRRTDLESENLELVWIQLFGIYSRPMLLGTCYRPPQFDQTFFELLNQNIDKVVMHDLLLMGDFNAKHSCWNDKDMTNRPGALLKDLLDSFNLDQLCSKPSHLHSSGRPESLLDLAITNVPECFLPPRTLEPLSTSDHLPIILEIKNNNNKFLTGPISDPSHSKHYLFEQKNQMQCLKHSPARSGRKFFHPQISMRYGSNGRTNFSRKSRTSSLQRTIPKTATGTRMRRGLPKIFGASHGKKSSL